MAPTEASPTSHESSLHPIDTSATVRPVDTTTADIAAVTADRQRPSSHLLRPEDAFNAFSPLNKSPQKTARRSSPLGRHDAASPNDITQLSPSHSTSRRRRDGRRSRTSSKRTKEKWKKLLWVKQDYPDNYTDENTFLDQLKRNPRLRPYEFWSLVADSTVIVQHLASVIIFLCCFIAIFQGRLSPVFMVSCATLCTVLAGALRDYWDCQLALSTIESADTSSSTPDHLGISVDDAALSSEAKDVATDDQAFGRDDFSRFSPRTQERLATIKSAILIYAALLGLSPILKSLTKSTSPDSIWAISSWLIVINIFTFDYGAGVETKYVMHTLFAKPADPKLEFLHHYRRMPPSWHPQYWPHDSARLHMSSASLSSAWKSLVSFQSSAATSAITPTGVMFFSPRPWSYARVAVYSSLLRVAAGLPLSLASSLA